MSAQLVIEELEHRSYEWDQFVYAHEKATFFHLSGWRQILSDYFGYECRFLYAKRGSEIVGVLPLTHFKNVLAGNALVSSPFLVYGGPVSADSEAEAALVDHAIQLAGSLAVDYLEIRSQSALPGQWATKDLYFYFQKAIAPTAKENLAAIPRKQRAVVRKGIKLGLNATWDNDLDRFYPIFAESYRNLGTPVFSKGLFSKLYEVFKDQIWLTTINHQGEDVASVMSFLFRDEVLPYYGGGKAVARRLYANDYMYWAVLERAAEEGYRRFDYGRSKANTGSYRFKKHWGFDSRPLPYQYHLVEQSELPNLSPSNPKFALAIEAWKKIPLPLATIVGPPIAKRVG